SRRSHLWVAPSRRYRDAPYRGAKRRYAAVDGDTSCRGEKKNPLGKPMISRAGSRYPQRRSALVGPYGPRFACALDPDIEPTATRAPRDALSAGYAAFARSHVARVFTAKTRSQSSTEYSTRRPGRLMPALLTRPSSPPNRLTASPTTRAGASGV